MRYELSQVSNDGLPEKQSIRDAMEHLFARYREIRPLFFVLALPMNEEWKIKPYLGVFPFVFNALHIIPFTLVDSMDR